MAADLPLAEVEVMATGVVELQIPLPDIHVVCVMEKRES